MCNGKLQQAADDHREGQRVDRLRQQRRHEQRRADEGQVQQHRREGRHAEFAPGVQDAAGKGDQRHEQDVGKHHARHRDRQRHRQRVGRKAAGHQQHDRGRKHDAGDRQRQKRPEHHGRHMVGQHAGGAIALLVLVFGEDGHEGLRERALGEQSAQQVGDAEGDEEGVGVDGRAKGPGDKKLADQAGDA